MPPDFDAAAQEPLPVHARDPASEPFVPKTICQASASCRLPPSSSPAQSGGARNIRVQGENLFRVHSSENALCPERLRAAPAGRKPPSPSLCIRRQISGIRDTASRPCSTVQGNGETRWHLQSSCDCPYRHP